jgi:transcription elongation factor Elf1
MKKYKKNRKKNFMKTTYTCVKCKSINEVSVSGYGKHVRSCPTCGEQYCFIHEQTRSYKDIDMNKVNKLPKDMRDKVLQELEEIIEAEETKKKELDALPKDEKGRPIVPQEKKDLLTPEGKMVIDKLIKEGINIDSDDPRDIEIAQKRFKAIFNDVMNGKLKNKKVSDERKN